MKFNIRDIVLFPFPYSDNLEKAKQRPVLIVGKCPLTNSYILVKITSTIRNSPDYSYVINNSDVIIPLKSTCEVSTEKLFNSDEKNIIKKVSEMRVDAYERVRVMILNNFPEA